MSKSPSSVIGLDLGGRALKAVLLQRKAGNRIVLTNYGVRDLQAPIDTADQLAGEVRALFSQMGGSVKACSVAITSRDSILRIIEQPPTPTEILREAVRLNGISLLNQDVREFVVDCDLLSTPQGNASVVDPKRKLKYLVGGLPRPAIAKVHEAFQKIRIPLVGIQLGPVCTFNAFEFAHERTFSEESFLLVDIGHRSSTVLVGAKRELVLVRSLEYGGHELARAVFGDHAGDQAGALESIDGGDDMMVEAARISLAALTREISSSIGFFEGRREESISRIYVSGAMAQSRGILQIMAEELHMPCEAWNPFGNCEVSLSASRKQGLLRDLVHLHVACGAAAECLKGR